jgi:FecR-like protein
MRRTTWLLSVVTIWATLLPSLVVAQDAVGVVTTLDGRANVARPTLTTPLALKFKDDVFGRDKISTQENSLVRVLLGGKAILTVRELSEVTITEDAGRAVVTLPDGKVVLAVAKQRMRPGESIEIRTPNAVAAVRGTIVAVTYDAPNQLTSVVCHTGECGYQFQNQTPVVLQPGTGAKNATTGPVSPAERAAAVNVAANAPHSEPGAETTALIIENGQRTAATLAGLVTGTPPNFALGTSTANPAGVVQPAPNDALTNVPTSFLVPEAQGTPQPQPPPPPPPTNNNPPPEPGAFPAGWTLTGVGSVIANLGSIAAPPTPAVSTKAGAVEKIQNGNFGTGMALIFTGTGAVPTGSTGPGVPLETSALSQTFSVDAGTPLVLRLKYNFLSNEFPTQSDTFNDTFVVTLLGPGSLEPILVAQESRKTSFTLSTVSPETASAGGFTIEAGNGVTGFKDVLFPYTPTSSGSAELIFGIADVGDTGVDSAALIDSVSILTDPPLFFVKRGETLTHAGREPLLRLTSTPSTFDSAMVVCCGGRATLAGPLLAALDSDLTVPFSLLSIYQGGSLSTSTTEPLVRLDNGRHTIGSVGLPMFDIWGVTSATDAQTGLTLGTDRPLQHAGPLLETSNATVSAHQAVRIDTALLEATAPLLNLRNGSKLSTAADAVQLSYQARVASLGSLVKLDRSAMVVASGAALNVGGGSVLRVTGDVFSLANGSTLSVMRGPLVSLSGGSILSVNGALIGFGGVGGNTVSVANSLCPCTSIGGIPVSLTGGAVAANVSITGAIKNGNLGALNLTPNAAVIRVDGAATKVTINGM